MAAPAGEAGPLHARPFQLRFAATRELGRSYVSLVKPRALPATVTGKFYVSEGGGDAAAERRALRRLRDMFALGPRDALPQPLTESHRYGWWDEAGTGAPAPPSNACLQHHIRDSAWLKARLLVLAADNKLKHN